MLRLKNININEDTAEADYYPEDSKRPLHIAVDLHYERKEALVM